ncbi:MAG: protein translocase subunit SecF, partial [Bdellovibrionales bacterium]
MNNKTTKHDWGRFDFLGIAKYITVGSIVLTAIAFAIMLAKGMNYGVDFAGGMEIQVKFSQAVEPGRIRSFMSDLGFPKANVQALGDNMEYLMHVEGPSDKSEEEANKYISETVEKIKTGLTSTFASEGAEVRRVDTVGPQVGAELKRNGILAGFYCLLLILVYVGLRFDYRFAPGAVFCLFHDAVITLGIYSLFDWEFTVQTLAAILTIIGYSLNDTIVIF